MRWYPDKKGLVTGLAVAGFGFGATLWVKLAGSWGELLVSQGLSNTFIIYGVVFALMCLVGAIWMVYPPADWKPEGWSPETAKAGAAAVTAIKDFTSSEMLRTAQFWMVWLCFVIGAGAGLMAIGLMKLYPMEALTSAGIEEASASAIAGTAMGVFYALFNGFGRIAWGWISDRTGRKTAIVAMLGIQGVIVLLFQFMAGQQYLLYLGAALIGFNFGGNFALFPTITADTFGQKFFSQNYGWVFLAYGVGGILFPILGGKLGDMGNFPMAFTITGILCLVAAGIAFMIRPPKAA
jgi:OFA family oxalate/formate antiporter-like MFS transporter